MTSISKRRGRHPAIFRRPGAGDKAASTPTAGSRGVDSLEDDGDQLEEGDEDDFRRPEKADEEKALFAGDTSTLPYDVRRAYALLLRGPSIDERHSKLWPILIAHEQRLRQLLHAVFLDLVIDTDQKVAFARPVHAPELDVPHLLRDVRLTFLDTALVLFLRMRLTLADAAGERATVSRVELTEHLKAYEASDNVDRSRFGRQIEGAIDKAKKYNFLRQIRNSSGERFEVSPALKLVFSHEQVSALLSTYRRISAPVNDPSDATAALGAQHYDSAGTDHDIEEEPT